ncbi:unnamed protein product, partial [Effrenium voratum]
MMRLLFLIWWRHAAGLAVRTNATAPVDFVLYVGAPRTGTQTMYIALQDLGFNPLHSGYNESARDAPCQYLFGNGTKEEALEVLRGRDAAMDEPFQFLYKEIMEAYPHSKFILPKVDLDEWIQSYQNFFKKMIIPKILNSTEEFEAYGMNKASAYVAVQAGYEMIWHETFTKNHCDAVRYWPTCQFQWGDLMTDSMKQEC